MLQDLNLYLSLVTSDERRAVVVEMYRTLAAILGEDIYMSVDQMINDDGEPTAIARELDEYALGLLTRATAAAGIQLDIDQLDAQDLGIYTLMLQTLYSIENHEDLAEFPLLIDGAADTVSALVAILERITPELEGRLDWIDQVSPALLRRICTVARSLETKATSKLPADYRERIKAFVDKHGASPVVARLLDEGVSLTHYPLYSTGLLVANLDPTDAEFPRALAETWLRSLTPNIAELRTQVGNILQPYDIDPATLIKVETAVSQYLE